ncbi:hypothetical protein [Paenibacillus aquistagni]|uniref:Uncharacterized protein n=1 Tax=Paenibacillus aquistagni TaxID=1852522 RepID=A0A1X7LXP9_9BACL|nr:hypothetical protein [Paenibacillus aquistagni]SMG58274.1 hypothetical protein SAMN06295960_4658 [Paenibacillus aquistagni]
MKEKLLVFLEVSFPFLIAVLFTSIATSYGFNSKIDNFEKIIDGTITFSSILVGFIAALMGILVSIKDSDIVKHIFQVRGKRLFAYYLSETVILGFITVIASGVMYPFIDKPDIILPFILWQFTIFWFLPSSMRIVLVMMLILFKSNIKEDVPENNNLSREEREEARIRNSKKRLQNS